ncbi:MAG: hypothetical protein M0C28_03545 [Candidatus Moduliflexus flocculans]|nr:hypothetical protein [Candidatus Moduliflexus flocculans]
MGKTEGEAWATEEIKIDYAMAYTMANGMMASMPGFEKILAEMKKIKGVVAYQTTTAKVMGSEVKSTTELLEAGNQGRPGRPLRYPRRLQEGQGLRPLSPGPGRRGPEAGPPATTRRYRPPLGSDSVAGVLGEEFRA